MIKYAKWAGYVLGLFMIAMGAMKFFGNIPIFTLLEDNLDSKYGLQLDFIEPQFKYITGVLEVIAGLLLLLGQRGKGGALSVLVIGGAIVLHIFVIGIYTPAGADIDGPKSPQLFIMAVASFLIALWVTAASRSKSSG